MQTRRLVSWSVAIILGTALFAEIGLRITLGLGSPPLLQADSTIGYLFQANQRMERFGNHIQINRYHQRSEALSATPDSSVLRVLFLGDSVTWGGVLVDQSDTYPEVFETAMDSACVMSVEALNASAGSWGIGNLRAYLKRFGTFDSDVVVFQIGSHDLLQEKSDSSPVGVHPSFPSEKPALAVEELVGRYLLPRIRSYWSSVSSIAEVNAAPAQPDSTVKARRFHQNMEMLNEMTGAVRQARATPLVLHTPNRNEVVAGSNLSYDRSYDTYRSRLSTTVDSLGIPLINLHERWKGEANASSYFRDEVHLSVEGNEAVASALVSAPLLSSRCATDVGR